MSESRRERPFAWPGSSGFAWSALGSIIYRGKSSGKTSAPSPLTGRAEGFPFGRRIKW